MEITIRNDGRYQLQITSELFGLSTKELRNAGFPLSMRLVPVKSYIACIVSGDYGRLNKLRKLVVMDPQLDLPLE